MRLIDADKLIEICRKGWKLFGREDEKLKHWVDEDDIRSQPTVEAIPIEYIERIIKESLYDQYARWEDISAQVDTDTMMKSWAILIERWKKENEKR